MIVQRSAYLADLSNNGQGSSSLPTETLMDGLKKCKFSVRGSHTADSLEEMVISAHPYTLYIGISAPTVTLTDVLDTVHDPPRTYFEHYLIEGLAPSSHLYSLLDKADHRLICTLAVNGRLDGLPLLSRIPSMSTNCARKPHNHSFITYLIPEYCTPLGKAKYYYIGVVAPTLIWRMQSLYLAEEASSHIRKLYDNWMKNNSISRNSSEYGGPDVNLILESITPRMAMENMNNERLEM